MKVPVCLAAMAFSFAVVLVAGMVLGYAIEEKNDGKAALMLTSLVLTQWLQLRATRRLVRGEAEP